MIPVIFHLILDLDIGFRKLFKLTTIGLLD
jgi:hypothetical protein